MTKCTHCDATVLSAPPAVGGEPVAWRWRPRGATLWIYDPTDEWRLAQGSDIETEPLYAVQPASPLREAEIWDNAFEYFKADTARAKLALKPAGWFIGDNEGGFHQAAEEFEGMDGTTPLYAAPSLLRGIICCYCDAPLSCARCGMEQPDDSDKKTT